MNPMDFLLTAFATFLGALIALASDRITRARDAKLREEAAINNLIMDLAAKRAFVAPDDDWAWGEGEIERVTDSVRHARTLIRDARLQLRPRSHALDALRDMSRACNTYLESAERDSPDAIRESLRQLSRGLTSAVRALHDQRPRHVLSDAPGSASFAEAR